MKRTLVVALLVVAICSVGSVAMAAPITINYSVAGWGPVTLANQGQPGDIITLTAYSGSLYLTDNTPTLGTINTLFFDVNYTFPSGLFPLDFSRAMTVNAVGGGLVQLGAFDSWTNGVSDYVELNIGSTSVFALGGGNLYVTPLGVKIESAVNGSFQSAVQGTFEWVQVPDGGATLTLLGCALIGIGAIRRKFRA